MNAPTNVTTPRRSPSHSARTSLPRPLAAVGVALTALAALTTACDDGSADGLGGSGGSSSSSGSTVVPGSDLDGTWQSACYMKTQTSLTYDKLALTGTFTEYTDDACTTPYHVSKWTGTGVVTGETAAGDTKLDLSFTSFTSIALTAENAAFNNMNQYCGATDWMANVEKDVLGKDCYGFSIPVGAKSLDIYRVAGAVLKFGQGSKIAVGLTEADRPTMLDDTRVFMKQ